MPEQHTYNALSTPQNRPMVYSEGSNMKLLNLNTLASYLMAAVGTTNVAGAKQSVVDL